MIDQNFFDVVYDRRNTGAIKYNNLAEDVIPMWIADMDFKSCPQITEALEGVTQHGIYGYGSTDEEFDSLVAGWYQRRFSWKIENEQIIKTPGVIFGVATAIRALTNPDDAVLICQPVYHPFDRVIKCNGRRTVVSELVLKNGRYEIDFEDFERKIKEENVKAFLFCSPHNPVGRVWTKEELEKIAKICLDNGVYIISDEIHSDFVYEGHVHIPIASLSSEIADRTITCVSPSKTFNIAGLQSANVIVSNSQLWQLIKNECAAMGYGHLNNMAAAAAKAAYKYGEEWLDAALKYLRENVDIVREAFHEDYPICALNPEGTFLVWLDCRKLSLSASELDTFFLEKAKVRFNNGEVFGEGGEGFMRMNIACPRTVLCEAIKRIKAEVDKIN